MIRRILLVLDGNPSSIYDILYSMNDFSDPKRTRMPKLLKAMEKDELVKSALQPGPLGPYRRIYEHGPKAGEYLRSQLRCGIETLMHFYLKYRSEASNPINALPIEPEDSALKGNVLFASYPNLTVEELETIRDAVMSREDLDVSIIGPDNILSRSGIDYQVAGKSLDRIDANGSSFDCIELHGVPPRAELAVAVSEFERVLASGGRLRILTQLVFLEEPKKPNLEQFIRITASTLFPEVGIVEGKDVLRVLTNAFGNAEVFRTRDEKYVFIAEKQ